MVTVVLGMVLSGCTDDAARPKPLPSPSSSPAPTASTPGRAPLSAPTLPAAARGTSAASAEAFARHYVVLLNYAMHSGDTSPMRQAAQRKCSGCTLLADAVDDVYDGSGRIVDGDWVLAEQSEAVLVSSGVRVQVPVRIEPQLLYPSPGESAKASTAENGRLDLLLERRSNEWSVARMDALR